MAPESTIQADVSSSTKQASKTSKIIFTLLFVLHLGEILLTVSLPVTFNSAVETFSLRFFNLGAVLLLLTALGCSLIGLCSRPTSRFLLLFLVGPTNRRRWPSLGNVCLTILGPHFTDGLEGLQLIQQLSDVVSQLIHNTVGGEWLEGLE